VASGLTIPWDVAPLPDGRLLVSERSGRLLLVDSGTTTTVSADLSDLFASGETGLMGLALDPDFASNGRFYTCQGHASPREIQVIAWTLDASAPSATRVRDPLVAELPIVSGRHGGCQLEIDADGRLIIGTGDAAVGSHPQDLRSLGGKTLRVDRSTGAAPADNPFADSTNVATRRILSYGHRNVQGIAIHPRTGDVWSVEHGPDRDDEVNRIVAGGNYGWNPVPGYNERVPMTDDAEFPRAIEAAWATGAPTLALSGAAFLSDPAWGSWRDGLAVTALKNRSLRLLFFTDDGEYRGQHVVIGGDYGRLRAAAQGPDGSLYVTTSNGAGRDTILRVRPLHR
jgi:glucose/arabinose dehydrogenase